jgi:hypothetical protein
MLTLLGSIGLPFSSRDDAAVMQKWFSATNDGAAADPYFLYAASNLGSFIALMAYPLVVEPNLRLQDQATLWTAGYVLLIVLSFACAAVVWRSPAPMSRTTSTEGVQSEVLSWGRRGRWIALAAVPSSLRWRSRITSRPTWHRYLVVGPAPCSSLTLVIAYSPSTERIRAGVTPMPVSVILLALVLIAALASPMWLAVPSISSSSR